VQKKREILLQGKKHEKGISFFFFGFPFYRSEKKGSKIKDFLFV
jgi:hypothetical protein